VVRAPPTKVHFWFTPSMPSVGECKGQTCDGPIRGPRGCGYAWGQLGQGWETTHVACKFFLSLFFLISGFLFFYSSKFVSNLYLIEGSSSKFYCTIKNSACYAILKLFYLFIILFKPLPFKCVIPTYLI
jgi:hypothetical protein